MHPGGGQNVAQTHVRIPRHHLVCARNGCGHQVKYGKQGFRSIRGDSEVVHVVCRSS